MSPTTYRTRGSIAVLALTLSLGLSACGGDSTDSASTTSASMSETMTTPSETTEAMGSDAKPFGAGCAAVPATGDGSFDGMAEAPVASAASANPLLTTLVAAVKQAGLVDTLNGAEGITVFAPTDDAFAKIPKATLDGVLADKKTLTAILTHHVVGQKLAPADLAGSFDTLNNDKVMVEGSGEDFTVDAGSGAKAAVICGNVQTANATVYIVDTVLMP